MAKPWTFPAPPAVHGFCGIGCGTEHQSVGQLSVARRGGGRPSRLVCKLTATLQPPACTFLPSSSPRRRRVLHIPRILGIKLTKTLYHRLGRSHQSSQNLLRLVLGAQGMRWVFGKSLLHPRGLSPLPWPCLGLRAERRAPSPVPPCVGCPVSPGNALKGSQGLLDTQTGLKPTNPQSFGLMSLKHCAGKRSRPGASPKAMQPPLREEQALVGPRAWTAAHSWAGGSCWTLGCHLVFKCKCCFLKPALVRWGTLKAEGTPSLHGVLPNGVNLLPGIEGITGGTQLGSWALGGATPPSGWLLEGSGQFGAAVPPCVRLQHSPVGSTAFLPVFPLNPRAARQGRVSLGCRISESESFLTQTLILTCVSETCRDPPCPEPPGSSSCPRKGCDRGCR